jgi:hypothetical protein
MCLRRGLNLYYQYLKDFNHLEILKFTITEGENRVIDLRSLMKLRTLSVEFVKL